MTEDIKNIISGLIKATGSAHDEIIVEQGDGGLTRFSVKTKDSGILIGREGQNFSALNHLVKRIVSQKYPDAQFIFDINDYQNQNIEMIKNKAVLFAERARSFETNVEMEPMSSYERMIIHSALAETPDIETESVGQGPTRRVVIKFKKNI